MRIPFFRFGLLAVLVAMPTACSSSNSTSYPRSTATDAPLIEGRDTEGKSFKLSDYRDKVVLLDFWANF